MLRLLLIFCLLPFQIVFGMTNYPVPPPNSGLHDAHNKSVEGITFVDLDQYEEETIYAFTPSNANQLIEMKAPNLPVIKAVSVIDPVVEQYGKFEAVLDLDATFNNPYDYNEIVVSAIFSSPSGNRKNVDGFFMYDYELNTINGALSPTGDKQFKIRFSPDEIGNWTFQVKVKDMTGEVVAEEMQFNCSAKVSEKNKGFVRVGPTNYLELDNEEQLILIGENMAWENANAYTDYKGWLTSLHNHGGNFIRLWHAHWGLGIEWKSGWEGFKGLRNYKESNCFYQDWLYDYCAEQGIYVMLTLQHHGPVSTKVNPNWNDSPYNSQNGGSCGNTWDFFKDSTAIAHTKNRYRYIVARWGYSRSIMAWELFNEVNWTDDFTDYQQAIQDWHSDMADYLKTIDPYNHLVTTSYANEDLDPVVWSDPNIDITQTHFYINSSNLESALAGGSQKYLDEYGKPTLNGEFGLGGNPDLSNADADGIHLHNGMWGALFGGGMGTAMSWWWDNYIHPRDLYYHFAPIANVAAQVPFVERNLQPTAAYVAGAPGDLVMSPNLDWGTKGDTSITINENGITTPRNPRLSQFLYGSEWNTQYRSPPSFTVTYPEEGEFSVKTSSANSNSPKISIYLNGNLVLDEHAKTDTTYTILVPAGQNLITVDNLGIDWTTITSYKFTGVGSKIDAYTLISANKDLAAGWVVNQAYNHQFVNENGFPDPVLEGELVIENFKDGDYFVKWHDCLTGEIIASEPVSAVGNQLFLPLPELYWDLAFRVDEEAITVNTEEEFFAQAIQFYPNPAKSGELITLKAENISFRKPQLDLFDASGRYIRPLKFSDNSTILPRQLEAGVYWLKITDQNYIKSYPLVIH